VKIRPVETFPAPYKRLHWLFTFLFRLLAQIEVSGFDSIPQTGGFVLATNHLSRLDTPLLMITCPRRVFVFVADKYRKFPVFNLILKWADAIWVRRGEADREALQAALETLRAGNVVGLAPEGTRSPTGGLQHGKPGVAFLASRANVPIVPVAVTGTERMLEDLCRLRRLRLRVVFDEPLYITNDTGRRLSSADLEMATESLMLRLARLLPAEYRGVYADSVI